MIAIEETIIDDLIKERDMLDGKIEVLNEELNIVKNKYNNNEKLKNEVLKKLKEMELKKVEVEEKQILTLKELEKKRNLKEIEFIQGEKQTAIINGRLRLLQGYRINKAIYFRVLS